MSTDQAEAQMDPLVPHLQALLAARCAWRDLSYFVQMCTGLCYHAFFPFYFAKRHGTLGKACNVSRFFGSQQGMRYSTKHQKFMRSPFGYPRVEPWEENGSGVEPEEPLAGESEKCGLALSLTVIKLQSRPAYL